VKNKTLLLARTLIKNGEGLGIRGSSTFTKVALILVFAILIPGLMTGISFLVANLLGILSHIGQEGVVLSWGIAIDSTIVFVFGIFYVISTFYFSSDVEMLLPLPLKPGQIMGAKFLVVTVYEYLTIAVFFLPVWITYGIYMGCGPLFYLYGLIVYLLMPVTPLAAASVIIMLVMRFTNLSRYKDTVKVLGGMIGVFIGVGVNVVMQNVMGTMSQEQIMELIQKGDNSLVVLTSGIFPTARWGAEAMIHYGEPSGLFSILLYVGFSVLIYLILLWLGQLIYLRGVMGLSETGSKRNKSNGLDLEKEVVKGSIIRTYTLVELKLLFRTPIYFINCVMINFLWPVFIILPLIFQPAEANMIHELSKILNKPGTEGMILAGSFAAALFLSATNGTASTSISREGQQLFVKKYLPVSYRQQLNAKILSGFILGFVSVLIMFLFAVFMFKLPLWLGLLILSAAWLPVLYTSLTGLLIDIYNPKLDWDSEQKAVKQNINVLYNMLAGIIPGALTVIAFSFSPGLPLTFAVLTGTYGLLCYFLGKLLYTKGVKRFIQLEA
jgi:ABC-2 type transport system permease protein